MTDDPARTSASTGSKQPIDLPLRRAMPAGLLIVFGLLSIVALGAGIWLLLKPNVLASVPVEQRRPAPADGATHATGTLAPAPTPSSAPTLPAPCTAFEGTTLQMSGDGVIRINDALERLCRLSGGGVSEELSIAIDGLGSATIRFAQFQVGGLESTTTGDTIWLNLRFARRGTSIEELLPPLLHEGYHLASGVTAPTALEELAARRAELDACKQLIARDAWPRWCTDAASLTERPEAEAIELLVAVGYARG